MRHDFGLSYGKIEALTTQTEAYDGLELSKRIPKTTAWRIDQGSSSRRISNNPDIPETRGRKPAMTQEDINRCDKILQEWGFEGRKLSWESLAYEAQIDVKPNILKKYMGTLDYRKSVACKDLV